MKDGKFEVGDYVLATGFVDRISAGGLAMVKIEGAYDEKPQAIYPDTLVHKGSAKTLPYDCVVKERDRAMDDLRRTVDVLRYAVENYVMSRVPERNEFGFTADDYIEALSTVVANGGNVLGGELLVETER